MAGIRPAVIIAFGILLTIVPTVLGEDLDFTNLTIEQGDVVELPDDASIQCERSTITNFGLLTKTVGARACHFIEANIVNHGTIRSESGAIIFEPFEGNYFVQNEGTTELAGGDFLFAGRMTLNGGSLRGSGWMGADVDNVGAVVAPGDPIGTIEIGQRVDFNGDYTQHPGATLAIDVAGLDPGTGHDQIRFEGKAKLDGKLEVTLADGFVPVIGDSITILNVIYVPYKDVTGAFAEVTSVNFPEGVSFNVEYNEGSVVLRFTNENPNTTDNVDSNEDDANTNDNSDTNSFVDGDGFPGPDGFEYYPLVEPPNSDAESRGFLDFVNASSSVCGVGALMAIPMTAVFGLLATGRNVRGQRGNGRRSPESHFVDLCGDD